MQRQLICTIITVRSKDSGVNTSPDSRSEHGRLYGPEIGRFINHVGFMVGRAVQRVEEPPLQSQRFFSFLLQVLNRYRRDWICEAFVLSLFLKSKICQEIASGSSVHI